MRIKLVIYGKNLGTRILGEIVSEEVNFLNREEVILDFKGVDMVTSSFADEVIGKNAKLMGFDDFKEKVKIENATDNIKAVIKKALMDRLTEI